MTMNQPDRGSEPSTTQSTSGAVDVKRKRAFRIGVTVGVAVSIAVVLLILQNGESAQIDWLVFHFHAPFWVILALTLVAGAVIWELIKTSIHRSRQLLRDRRARS
jgi:uncharacterized integral membrane protein